MRIIRKKTSIMNFYESHKGSNENLITLRRNISLLREREIDAMVSMAQNILFDRYEDVVSRENVNKQY